MRLSGIHYCVEKPDDMKRDLNVVEYSIVSEEALKLEIE